MSRPFAPNPLRTAVRVDRATADALRVEADRRGVRVAALVRQALAEWLRSNGAGGRADMGAASPNSKGKVNP